MARSDGRDYFQRTSAFWIVSVTFGISLYTWLVFAPQAFPYQCLGLFGTFCKHLVENYAGLMYKGWWAALAIHVAEALVSLKICRNKGIDSMATRCMWFTQTLLFGFASLGLLLKFDPERRKQH